MEVTICVIAKNSTSFEVKKLPVYEVKRKTPIKLNKRVYFLRVNPSPSTEEDIFWVALNFGSIGFQLEPRR